MREDDAMPLKWLESLSPEARARAEALIESLRELGAPSPGIWAHREFREGLPQVSRHLLLSHLRDETVDAWRDSTLWVDNLAEDASRHEAGSFSDASHAVASMLRAGIDRSQIGALARFIAYEAAFSVLHTIDEGYDPDREGDLPGWALVERDPLGGLTGRILARLHVDLATASRSDEDG
jgi:hypothetical protein